jgi:hypothetical protein
LHSIHDTLNDVVNALDPDTFEECFEAWIGVIRPEAPDLIAIDGKTSKRIGDPRTGQHPLRTLSAYPIFHIICSPTLQRP